MYNKILVAMDLSEDTNKVIDAAIRMAGNDTHNIHLVHVVEPVAAAYSMDIYAININQIQQEALNLAEQRLGKIADDLGLDSKNRHCLMGAPASEIRNLAAEINADAIVMGSHGHSGWKILLGSTASKVLHGATCDVLTIHVG